MVYEELSKKGLSFKVFNLVKGLRIYSFLNAGCGEFALTKMLHDSGKMVSSCDLYNKKETHGFDYKAFDLNKKWIYSDDSFDCILLLEVIEHLENPRHVFRQLQRIVKKKGYAVITSPNPGIWISALNLFLRGNLWGFSQKEYTELFIGHITPLFHYDFERLAKEHNFEIIKRTSLNNFSNRLFADIFIFILRKKE